MKTVYRFVAAATPGRRGGAWLPLALLAVTTAGAEPTAVALRPIFNGRDLEGWRAADVPECWRVVDGAIVGESDARRRGSMLYTEADYGDVAFEGEVRFEGEIDSGVMLRRPEVQVQLGVSRSLKRDMTCSFYVGRYPEEARARDVERLWRAGDWNRIRVEARGARFTVWLNGTEVSGYESTKHAGPGPIGLQIHAGVPMRVEFRALAAAALPSADTTVPAAGSAAGP